jgi:tetratricopeptide (TPR) repeat protein
MKKNHKTLIILFSAINVFAQNNVIDKTSNNLTLDGNVEFIDKNLIQAESFYRKAISKDSLNNIASYNMANSFYKSGFNKEAINEYKSSIVKAKSKEDLHKSFHNLGDAFMKNKDYQNAVNAFKKALLNKPSDDETRYNYALAKELLKNEQKNKKKDDKNKDKNKDDKKKDEKKEDKNGDKKKDEKKENKPKPNQISPEQLKNLLKAMNNEEKKVQEKVNKNKIKGKPVKNKKDW